MTGDLFGKYRAFSPKRAIDVEISKTVILKESLINDKIR